MQCLHSRQVTVSLIVYLFYLGVLTLAPFEFSTAAMQERTWTLEKQSTVDFVVNILGFLPLGCILYLLTCPESKTMILKWGITIGTAAIVSLSIEIGQMFIPTRFPSPLDILANTLGGGLGFWLTYPFAHRPWIAYLKLYQRALAVSGLACYLGTLTGLVLWLSIPQKLQGWDPRYPLLIGNEATLDRPWHGKIYLLALYDRVLTDREIESQFQAGSQVEPEFYLDAAPIALYSFREIGGIHVRDHSSFGPPVDLEITGPHKAIWLPQGGLALTGATVLQSSERPAKIHQRLTATDAFSVAAWIEPTDALQAGPARIVSFSLNPSLRNFTLGQERSEIHFRVRNPLAGPNGDRVNLRTKGLGLRPRLTHIVATYDRGREQLYVNGALVQKLMTNGGLSFLAQTLQFESNSRWQRGLLLALLLAPVGGCWTLLQRGNRRK